MPGSSKLPSVSWREVLKALMRIGFVPVRQSGSHIILRDEEGARVTVLKLDPIGKGLLMAIIAEAGITRDEFLKLLRGSQNQRIRGHSSPSRFTRSR